VDGREAPAPTGYRIQPDPIQFSADGRHVLHVQGGAVNGRNDYQVAINGKPVPGYSRLPIRSDDGPPLSFTPDGKVNYLSAKDGTMYLVTAAPAPGDSLASLPAAAVEPTQAQASNQPPAGKQKQTPKKQQQQEEAKEKPTKEEQRAQEAAKKADDALKAAKSLGDLLKKRN
jgi:hypothetical protein